MNTKFVNLHAHSCQSIGDGLGFPEDHFNFAISNGMDSMALTEHGNMNGLGYMVQAHEKIKKKGIPFRVVFGIEAYYHPDLELWQKIKDGQTDAEVDGNELVVENESESKNNKWADPLRRRHHLVILCQNYEGYQNLCRLTTESYRKGFYRFPRMDFRMLEKYNKGLIISSACLGSIASFSILQNYEKGDAAVFAALDKEFKPLLELFGKDRANIEIQFNKLPEQRIVNDYLIRYSKMTGYHLLATADSHYYNPNVWREREIYRLLAQQSKGYNVSQEDLPKSIDELKCLLYPKNGDQMFDTYCEMYPDSTEELDAIVLGAIERSYYIAHNQIEEMKFDRSMKLPKSFLKGDDPDEKLSSLCLEALLKLSEDWPEEKFERYAQRLKIELDLVIKKGLSLYFLALKEALDKIRDELLTGMGRGSAASSMICYLLKITFVDPIEHKLLFERFMSEARQEPADCLHEDTLAKVPFGYLPIKNLKVGDLVVDINGTEQIVLFKSDRSTRQEENVYEVFLEQNGVYGAVVASANHKFIKNNGDVCFCEELKVGDHIHPNTKVVGINKTLRKMMLVDITVSNSSTFKIVPFPVVELEDENLSRFLFYVPIYNIDTDVGEIIDYGRGIQL